MRLPGETVEVTLAEFDSDYYSGYVTLGALLAAAESAGVSPGDVRVEPCQDSVSMTYDVPNPDYDAQMRAYKAQEAIKRSFQESRMHGRRTQVAYRQANPRTTGTGAPDER